MNFLTSYEVIGVIVTSATALFTYLRSSNDAKNQNTAIASVIGVIFTLSMGLRFDVIPKVQSQMIQAEAIRRDPFRRKLLERVASLGSSVTPANPLMSLVLKGRMDSLRENFDQMASGRFTVDSAEMPLFRLQMIESAKKSIGTTNYIGLSKWWEEPSGDKYELANETAARRGVAVTRIFLFSNQQDLVPAKGIMVRENVNRIRVRYAFLSDLPPFTGDIIVIDGALAGEHRFIPLKGLSEALFSTEPAYVDKITRTLQQIEASARDFTP